MQYLTIQYLTLQYNAIQYNTIQYQNPVNKIKFSQDVPLFGQHIHYTAVTNKRAAFILRDRSVGPARVGSADLWRWGQDKRQFSETWQQS